MQRVRLDTAHGHILLSDAATRDDGLRVLGQAELLGWRGQIFTSSALPARTGRSERLADPADVTGACAYLCGTGGMIYLDHAPFTELGVAVIPFRTPTTGLWASGRQVSALRALASRGPDAVGARFHALAFAHDALGCAA
ncbi:hypothetical protein [Streptomyces olivaceus]|uniref:hypothetical protein n=1 Tax=Streptomyces olivaceus TaxID=47716 RepID=UPI003715F446